MSQWVRFRVATFRALTVTIRSTHDTRFKRYALDPNFVLQFESGSVGRFFESRIPDWKAQSDTNDPLLKRRLDIAKNTTNCWTMRERCPKKIVKNFWTYRSWGRGGAGWSLSSHRRGSDKLQGGAEKNACAGRLRRRWPWYLRRSCCDDLHEWLLVTKYALFLHRGEDCSRSRYTASKRRSFWFQHFLNRSFDFCI